MSQPLEYGGKTALYIEDQPKQVQAIQDLLRGKLGLQLLVASTPDEAREFVVRQRLDLIILDIRIWHDGGSEQRTAQDWTRCGLLFLKDLRKGKFGGLTPKSVPVLAITCVVNTVDVQEILEAGNSSGGRCLYLAKPVGLGPVEDAVRELLA